MKRIFSLLLAWVMICGILPLSAFADDMDGTATASPITSVVDSENRTVTWNFAETIPEAEKTVYDAANEYAALRVGLGAVEDNSQGPVSAFTARGVWNLTVQQTRMHRQAGGISCCGRPTTVPCPLMPCSGTQTRDAPSVYICWIWARSAILMMWTLPA